MKLGKKTKTEKGTFMAYASCSCTCFCVCKCQKNIVFYLTAFPNFTPQNSSYTVVNPSR